MSSCYNLAEGVKQLSPYEWQTFQTFRGKAAYTYIM